MEQMSTQRSLMFATQLEYVAWLWGVEFNIDGNLAGSRQCDRACGVCEAGLGNVDRSGPAGCGSNLEAPIRSSYRRSQYSPVQIQERYGSIIDISTA